MTINIRGLTTLLQVFDMQRSVTFYRDHLGFEVVMTSQPGKHYDWAMLRWGDAQLMLNSAYEELHRPPSPDASRVTAHADTILYFLCDDADSAYAELLVKGCQPDQPVTTYYGMRQVYLRDPDGYELCFQHPVSGTQEPDTE